MATRGYQRQVGANAVSLPAVRPLPTSGEGEQLAQVGQALSQVGQVAGRIVAEENQRVAAEWVVRRESELFGQVDTYEATLRASKGEEAFVQASKFDTSLQRHLERLQGDAPNPLAAQALAKRAEIAQRAWRRSRDTFLSGERTRMAEEALQGTMASSLRRLTEAGAWRDFKVRNELIAIPEGPIRAATRDPVLADEKVLAWRQQTSEAMLAGVFADETRTEGERAQEARDLLGSQVGDGTLRDALGPEKAAGWERRIAEFGRKERADQAALEILGRLDLGNTPQAAAAALEAAVRDARAEPSDDPLLKDETVARLERMAADVVQQRSAEVAELVRASREMTSARGWPAVERKDDLRRLAPEVYEALRGAHERKQKQRIGGSGGAAARREQADLDAVLINGYLARPPRERVALDLELAFMDSGISERAFSEAQKLQQKDRDRQERLVLSQEDDLRNQVLRRARGLGLSRREQDVLAAEATRAYAQHVDKTGNPPDLQEMLGLGDDLLRAHEVPRTIGGIRLPGTSREYGYQRARRLREESAAGAPRAQPGVGWLYSTDRTVRIRADANGQPIEGTEEFGDWGR